MTSDPTPTPLTDAEIRAFDYVSPTDVVHANVVRVAERIIADRVAAARADAWPCANYLAPRTCLTTLAVNGAMVGWCGHCCAQAEPVAAAAWDEGHQRGYRDGSLDIEPADNPYRKEADHG